MGNWVLPLVVVGVLAGGSECAVSSEPSVESPASSLAPDPMEGVDPCTFFTAAEQAGLPTYTRFTVHVVASPLEGYARGATTEALPDIGRHQALMEKDADPPASCTVAVAAGRAYTVTSTVTGGAELALLCELALRVAAAVEPDLPV